MTQDWVTSTLMTMTVLMLEQYGPVTRSFHTFTILDFTIIPCVALAPQIVQFIQNEVQGGEC